MEKISWNIFKQFILIFLATHVRVAWAVFDGHLSCLLATATHTNTFEVLQPNEHSIRLRAVAGKHELYNIIVYIILEKHECLHFPDDMLVSLPVWIWPKIPVKTL